MGVGFAADLVVCVALGIDMFDCVFPTRTAVSINILLNVMFLPTKHKHICLEIRLCVSASRPVEFETVKVCARHEAD